MTINNFFYSKLLGQFENTLVIDTSKEEFVTFDSIFVIILFENSSFKLFKIKGKSISKDNIKKAIDIVNNSKENECSSLNQDVRL